MGIFSSLKKTVTNPAFLPLAMTGNVPAAIAASNPKKTLETAASMVKQTAKTAIQFPRAVVSGAAGIAGNEKVKEEFSKPIDVPLLGEVKALSAVPEDVEKYAAQTPKETLVQAGSIFLEGGAPYAGSLASAAGKTIKKALPSIEKTGEALSGVSKKVLEKAATPEVSKAIKELRELGIAGTADDAAAMGEDVFSTAQKVRKEAMDTYKATREAIITQKQGQVLERSKDFVSGVQDVLSANKVKTGEKGLDLVGSQFEGSASAKSFLDRAYGIMSRPVSQGTEAVDDLLTRREALTSVIDEIPKNEKNLLRVVKDMRKSFDSTLDNVLGKEATALRESYAKAIQPSESVVKAMTTDGRFSPDKARSFMEQAMSTVKFDKRAILSELDNVAGTGFARTAEAMGIDKAISQLSPAAQSRVFDVLKTFVIAKLPFVSAFVSPKFWGEVALAKGGKKAAEGVKQASAFGSWLTKNILTIPLRERAMEAAQNAADSSFEDEFEAEQVQSKAMDLTEDNLSDEELIDLFGAEPVE